MAQAVKDISSLHPTVNASKFTPPQLPRIFRRDRLIDLIDAFEGRRLILIVGQPAQGKTTLAADYVLREKRPAIWLHLDAEAGSEANFLLLLRSAATRVACWDLDKEAGYFELVSLGVHQSSDRFKARLNALFSRLPSPVDIFLDGIDQLPDRAPALELINTLITRATPATRLFLIAREMPPLPIQPLIVKQEAAVIDNDTLAFTEAEIHGYFHHIHQIDLSCETIRHLRQVTGGWSGGLVIISQSLGQIPQNHWNDFLHAKLRDRFSGEASNYFSQEVFTDQPEEVRQFLMRSALLDLLDPGAVAVVTAPLPSREHMERLAGKNIFTETLYDERFGAVYRYNPLFRQFLRAMGENELPAAERDHCLARAGDHYRKKREYETAIRYFLQAGAFNRAAEGIKKVGIDLVITGRLVDLEQMVAALPARQVRADPWMEFYGALAKRLQDGRAYIDRLARVQRRFAACEMVRGRLLALAFLIEAHVFLGHGMSNCVDYLTQSEKLLNSLGTVSYWVYARAMLWLQIGFGHTAGGIDPARGVSAARNSTRLALQMKDSAMQVNAGIISALGYTMIGDFERADRTLADIRQLVRTSPYPEYDVLQRLVRLQLDLRKGDFDAVAARRESIRKDIASYGMLFFYPAYVEATGLFHIYRGRVDDARTAARHLADLATMDGNDRYHGLAAHLYGMTHYFTGDFVNARDAALKALALMGPHDTLQGMQAGLLAALAGIQLGDYKKARTELNNVLAHAVNTDNTMIRCESLFALALLAQRTGDASGRNRHLAEACDIAAQRAYTRLVILSPQDLHELAAPRQDPAENRFFSWPPALALEPRPSTPAPSLPGPEAAKISQGRGPDRLTIQTFGGLKIRMGDAGAERTITLTGKPKVLLMAMVARGLRDIPREILMDDLWPESPEPAARRNFKVTLHRLRKAFKPDGNVTSAPVYILLRDNRMSLNPDLCRVDVEQFLTACKDVRRHQPGTGIESPDALGRKITALYQGDFLPEDLYTPWIDMKRLALRDEFVQTLLALGETHRQRGRVEDAIACCQAVLEVDPCQEGPVMALMKIFSAQGRVDRARQVYQRLKAHLQRHLGEMPSSELTRLFQRMKS